MNKDHEPRESALKEASRGTGLVLLVSVAILVIAGLFYFGLGGFDSPGT